MRGGVDVITKTYRKISLWLSVGITLLILLAGQIMTSGNTFIGNTIGIVVMAVLYFIITNIVTSNAWIKAARKTDNSLTRFYIVAPMIKMVVALVVILFIIISRRYNKTVMLESVSVFAIYYVVQLLFDCIYYSRVEKNKK